MASPPRTVDHHPLARTHSTAVVLFIIQRSHTGVRLHVSSPTVAAALRQAKTLYREIDSDRDGARSERDIQMTALRMAMRVSRPQASHMIRVVVDRGRPPPAAASGAEDQGRSLSLEQLAALFVAEMRADLIRAALLTSQAAAMGRDSLATLAPDPQSALRSGAPFRRRASGVGAGAGAVVGRDRAVRVTHCPPSAWSTPLLASGEAKLVGLMTALAKGGRVIEL